MTLSIAPWRIRASLICRKLFGAIRIAVQGFDDEISLIVTLSISGPPVGLMIYLGYLSHRNRCRWTSDKSPGRQSCQIQHKDRETRDDSVDRHEEH